MNYYDQRFMYYQPHIAEQYYPPPPPQVAAAFNDYYCNSSNQHSDSRSLRHRKQRKPRKLTRSLSTGTISPQQAHYQDYDWYEYEPVPTTTKRKSKKRYSSNTIREHEPRNEPIDPDKFLANDGEPMNENELLALANSRINEVICKSENNKYNIPAPTPSPPTVIPNTKEQKDLSNLMDSLTIEESITSTINGSPTDSYSPVEPETKQKKKKWPFGFLFKKAIPEPEKSSSTPTTPSLSPSSVLSISPPFQPQLLQERVWAYKLPMAPMTNNIKIWLRFDPENQKRINNLVLQQPNGLIQLFDSRFGQGAIPMVVMPSCKTCYFPLFNGQFDYMAIDYLLNE